MRGLHVCLEMARRLRRVPSVDEVLKYLCENGLHTGAWEENEMKRRERIAYNLAYIKKTFDPKMGRYPLTLDLAEFRSWVDEHYPDGICSTSPEEVCVFLAITKFCVLVDPNPDGSLPYKRFRKCWKGLYDQRKVKRQFRWNRFHEISGQLIVDKVIRLSGGIARGRARIWELGPAFPGFVGLVGDTEQKLKPSACSEEARGEERKGKTNLLTAALKIKVRYW